VRHSKNVSEVAEVPLTIIILVYVTEILGLRKKCGT